MIWRNNEKTILTVTQDDGHVVVVEPGHPLWDVLSNSPDILPYVEPPPAIPSVVSMRQARRALLEKSLLASVDSIITSLPSPEKEAAEIDWVYAQEVKRSDPLVQALASALELTKQDLDNLFLLASTF
jgi:hypothetical protein